MFRFSLHVPLFLNDGTPTPEGTLDLIERELLDIGGGFTALDGIGAWKSETGVVYREPVRVYHVDVPVYQPNNQLMLAVADLVADALDQEAAYMTVTDIEARTVTPVRP